MGKRLRSAFAFALALCCLGAAGAQDQDLGKVEYQYFNDLSKAMSTGDFRVYYDPAADVASLFFARPYGGGWIRLPGSRLSGLRAVLQKYLDWEKLAIEKSVEMRKALPDSPLRFETLIESGGKRSPAAGELQVAFQFVSRSVSVHWLQLDAPAAVASLSASFSLGTIFIDHAAALGLLDLLSDSSLAAKRKAEADKKALDEAFN